MPVGDHNFAAQSHQQLYDKIRGNTNGSAADATNDAWNSFRAVMGNAKAEVESALRDAKAVWTGTAGESFGSGMAPLVQWAEGARAAGVDSHNAFQATQSYYTGTRDRMPEPVQLSATSNGDYLGIPAGFTHLVGGQTDQDIEEQKANDAKREAVRVMNDYRGGAVDGVSSVGTFTEPPKVTLDVAQPKVEQSEAQQQYSQQFNDRYGANNTNFQSTPQQQQSDAVAPPPSVPQSNDDTTKVSDANPPTQVRPGPLPITPPVPGPTPVPPVNTPIPGPIPPLTRLTDRLGGGNAPTGKTPTGNGQRGGFGSGNPKPGGGVGSGQPGQQQGQQPGRGPASGVGSGEPHTNTRPGANTAGVRGGAGMSGMGMAGAPQSQPGEEDKDHKAAPYLEELDDIWGENEILVAPPVIGDDQQ